MSAIELTMDDVFKDKDGVYAWLCAHGLEPHRTAPGVVIRDGRAALRAVGCDNRTAMVCKLLRGQVRLRTESNAGRPGVPRQRREKEAQ